MSLPRAVEAVVFDMDGLLVDTETLARDVMTEACHTRGLDLPAEVFLAMVGLPDHASRAVAMAHFGEAFDYEPWQAEAWALAHARTEGGALVKAGAVELLDWLDGAALPRAIATSSSRGAVERHLGPSGLLERFDAILAAGDYSLGKPNPDPFLAAAARLGVNPDHCVALEDSHNGVRAAHAAGMMTIMVPDLLPATVDITALCVAVAPSLHGVRRLLEAHVSHS